MKNVTLTFRVRRFDRGAEVNLPVRIKDGKFMSIPGWTIPEAPTGSERETKAVVPVGTVATLTIVRVDGHPTEFTVRLPSGELRKTSGRLPNDVWLSAAHMEAVDRMTERPASSIDLRQEIGRRTIVRIPVFFRKHKGQICMDLVPNAIPRCNGVVALAPGDAVLRITQERYGQATAWTVLSEGGRLLAQGVGAPSGWSLGISPEQTEGLFSVFGVDPFGIQRLDQWKWWSAHAQDMTADTIPPWGSEYALQRMLAPTRKSVAKETKVLV